MIICAILVLLHAGVALVSLCTPTQASSWTDHFFVALIRGVLMPGVAVSFCAMQAVRFLLCSRDGLVKRLHVGILSDSHTAMYLEFNLQ